MAFLFFLCLLTFRAVAAEPSHPTPSMDDLLAAQNELREFADYYIGRKPSIDDQTRKEHAGDKIAALFKSGIQSSTFIDAFVSRIARDLAFSEQEHFKQIPEAPFLNLQRLMRDQLKAANELAIIQAYQQQRIIEQNERLIRLLEQTHTPK
jgi:hypothetical protein